MTKIQLRRRELAKALHEILLSLNLATAFSFAITADNFQKAANSKRTSDAFTFVYYFLRAGIRANKLLHLYSSNPLYGPLPNPGSQVGLDLAFTISVIAIGMTLLLLLRLAAKTRLSCAYLKPIGGFLSLITLPAVYFCLSQDYWPWTPSTLWGLAEVSCVVILFLVHQWRSLPTWALGFVVFAHCSFWVALLWDARIDTVAYQLNSSYIMFLVFPLSGLAWLLYSKVTQQATLPVPVEHSRTKTKLVLAIWAGALVLAGSLWLPRSGYRLSRVKNLESLAIEMRRMGCVGQCPVYVVTIHGNGVAEYVGLRYVRDHGPQSLRLSQDQVQSLLRDFDQADFFDLEDGAFAWGFHSPRVNVKITTDGRTKEVSGDAYFIGSETGPQARFVKAADEIDRIVDSARWVKCEDRCNH